MMIALVAYQEFYGYIELDPFELDSPRIIFLTNQELGVLKYGKPNFGPKGRFYQIFKLESKVLSN
jgi:hypothetical protein